MFQIFSNSQLVACRQQLCVGKHSVVWPCFYYNKLVYFCYQIVETKFVSECALLQPITSMISSLIFVKAECVAALYALPRTSLAENKLICTEGDVPQCSKQFSNDTFPIEADFCVNLDRLFASDGGMYVVTLIEQSPYTIVFLQLPKSHNHF